MILVVDDSVGRHLAHAVRAYIRELRRDGVPVPRALADVAAIAATGGQVRPSLDGAPPAGEPGGVDQLTVDYRAAGDRLGVSDRTVRRLVEQGDLPAVQVAGCTRIRTSDLQEYVDALPAVHGKATR